MTIRAVRLGRLRLELLLHLQERLGAFVIHEPLALGLFVKRQDGQARDAAIAAGLLQEPLGTRDTDLAECPIRLGGETLQFESGLEGFGVRGLFQGGGGSE